MVKELKDMGIELMVSIWPTVDKRSENFEEMQEKGYLIRVERGVRIGLDFQGETIHYDATNPGARAYLWQKAQANYYSKGIKVFWLDEAGMSPREQSFRATLPLITTNIGFRTRVQSL
jgi:alpha-D-xyloside xylohydrolase